MVFYHRNLWYAECVDLDLVVARPSAADAIQELADQIDGHVTTVLEEGLPASLLNRPAPWTHRVRWWLYAARVSLGRLFHRRFAVPRPLHLDRPMPVHA